MEKTNLIFLGLKGKYRFTSNVKSNYTIEDLVHLDYSELNTIAKMLNKQIMEDGEDYVKVNVSPTIKKLENQLEIVKFIIEMKQKDDELRAEKLRKIDELKELQEDLREVEAKERKKRVSKLNSEDLKRQMEALKSELES